MNYPGDLAEPRDVARWMSWVAENDFSLPGILPVMTSCVEITDAWTGPGDIKDVPGYLYAIDHDSLGYFQQRAGWGTSEQRIDANYALRAFCNAARNLKDYEWHKDTTDPDVLGRWAQAVQRSAYPDRYASKGYEMALELLKEESQVWPEKVVQVSSDGWAYVAEGENRVWLRATPGLLYAADGEGWLKQESFDPPPWEWPEANEEPTAGNYQDRHPTRYNWLPERPDVEAWARFLVDNYRVSVNTYYDHPEGYGRDKDSIDVWGPGGRNDPVDPSVGQEIFDLLFSDTGKPDWEWGIWWETIYGAWNGWAGEPFGDGSEFMAHRNHLHITYAR